MSKTGKWLLIFGAVALAGVILFAVSVAAFGVRDGNYGISIGGNEIGSIKIGGFNMGNFLPGNSGIHFRNGTTTYDFDFETGKQYDLSFGGEEIKDLDISLAICTANIVCSDTDTAALKYTAGNAKTSFTAEAQNGTLRILEKPASWFNFGTFKNSSLELTLPETVYESVVLNLASGKIATSGLTSDSLSVTLASGSMDLGAYADDIGINVASGKMALTNCTDKKAANLNVEVASGTAEVNGLQADRTKAELASGNIILNGISGRFDGEIASGKLTAVFSEWTDDIGLQLASGKADITLPAGSGVNAKLQKLSGSMSIDLDGSSTKLTSNTTATFGGANVHDLTAEVASGSISVHN